MRRSDFILLAAIQMLDPEAGGSAQAGRALRQGELIAVEATRKGTVVFDPEPEPTHLRDAVTNMASILYQIKDRAIKRKGMGGDPTLVLDEEATRLFLSLFENQE